MNIYVMLLRCATRLAVTDERTKTMDSVTERVDHARQDNYWPQFNENELIIMPFL